MLVCYRSAPPPADQVPRELLPAARSVRCVEAGPGSGRQCRQEGSVRSAAAGAGVVQRCADGGRAEGGVSRAPVGGSRRPASRPAHTFLITHSLAPSSPIKSWLQATTSVRASTGSTASTTSASGGTSGALPLKVQAAQLRCHQVRPAYAARGWHGSPGGTTQHACACSCQKRGMPTDKKAGHVAGDGTAPAPDAPLVPQVQHPALEDLH